MYLCNLRFDLFAAAAKGKRREKTVAASRKTERERTISKISWKKLGRRKIAVDSSEAKAKRGESGSPWG